MYGAAKLIGAFIGFIDGLHTTLKEQQEITQNLQGELSEIQSDISGVNSELETTAKRIDELNSKDTLSFVEVRICPSVSCPHFAIHFSLSFSSLE